MLKVRLRQQLFWNGKSKLLISIYKKTYNYQ